MKGTNAKNKCKEKREKRRAKGKLHACDDCPSSPKEKLTMGNNVRRWGTVGAKESVNNISQTM
jgi:hypothetical protein